MSDKNFNPSWEGYMGDFLKGNVGINQLKPQHEFLDSIGLEKALSDRLPRHNMIVVKHLTRLALASILFSLPVSLYVNYKLKHDGYLTCDRISWMSPTTYVKDLSLCR
ncbi:Protein of uncharacterised function (DUF1240) [Serratia fonticola]|uniref:DUF1240 domain-containing protein n=1 Tax=Serratia TaxID=613 RepID=UPI0009F5F5BA|nr:MULTISPECIES: DUF1240 domain-containing protein [Serratia]CAI1644009.1 Protein of uncharacterised function (DUF1240) [Serratia fonticola]